MSITTPQAHRRVRVGTIVWGTLLVAAAVIAIIVLTTGPLSPAAALWVIVGVGALLVVSALVTAIVRAGRSRVTTEVDDAGDQPIG